MEENKIFTQFNVARLVRHELTHNHRAAKNQQHKENQRETVSPKKAHGGFITLRHRVRQLN
jgi:hypothetical protein